MNTVIFQQSLCDRLPEGISHCIPGLVSEMRVVSRVTPLMEIVDFGDGMAVAGWWQLKHFRNFHPEPWGNHPN